VEGDVTMKIQQVFADYVEAFKKCYPSAKVVVTKAKRAGKLLVDRNGFPKYWVYINGDHDDRPLTLDDLITSTADLSR